MISGDITAAILDHLPRYLFAPNVLSKASCQKSNIYERYWSKFFQKDFELDHFDKNWSNILQLDQQDVNLSIESFLNNMNSILDKHAPLKRINKYNLKFRSKPWKTPAIQKIYHCQKQFVKKVHKCKRLINKINFS